MDQFPQMKCSAARGEDEEQASPAPGTAREPPAGGDPGVHARAMRLQRPRATNGCDRVGGKFPTGCRAGEVLRAQNTQKSVSNPTRRVLVAENHH